MAQVVVVALVMGLLLPGRGGERAHQRHVHEIGVETLVHGLRLSLSVRKAGYPRNGLIRVRVSVRDVSGHDVALGSPDGCMDSPGVQVVDEAGKVVYPPALPPIRGTCGAVRNPLILGQGQVVTREVLVVLRGNRLQAVAVIKRSAGPDGTFVKGQPIRLPLAPATAPRVSLGVRGGAVFARLLPSSRVNGPLLYVDEAECKQQASRRTSEVVSGHHDWTVGSNLLTPGCSPARIWHVVAGWLNHPVAVIDYVSH